MKELRWWFPLLLMLWCGAAMAEEELMQEPNEPYIGLSEAQVTARWGEPISRKGRKKIYRLPLGPGAHSHQTEVELTFKGGKVIRAKERKIPIGCVIVEPVDKD